VQRWLGHHSPAFTLSVYVHLLDDDLHRGENPIELIFNGDAREGNDTGNPTMYPIAASGPYYATIVCAGTLDITAAIASRTGFGGFVVGADFAEPMLRAGKSKLSSAKGAPVAADALQQHLARHLPLAEARHLDALREIFGGMLDGVMDVMRRHLHRQPDAVLRDLLELCFHGAIQAGSSRARSNVLGA